MPHDVGGCCVWYLIPLCVLKFFLYKTLSNWFTICHLFACLYMDTPSPVFLHHLYVQVPLLQVTSCIDILQRKWHIICYHACLHIHITLFFPVQIKYNKRVPVFYESVILVLLKKILPISMTTYQPKMQTFTCSRIHWGIGVPFTDII